MSVSESIDRDKLVMWLHQRAIRRDNEATVHALYYPNDKQGLQRLLAKATELRHVRDELRLVTP